MPPANVFILGAPRSGTSLMAGVLSGAGYLRGENQMPADERNPHGYFESLDVNFINEEILKPIVRRMPIAIWRFLQARGWQGLTRGLFPMLTPYGKRFLAHIPPDTAIPKPTAEHLERMRLMVSSQPFCLKDPRFSYTLNHWRGLAPDSRMICMFRDPCVTAHSMIRYPWPFTPDKALRTWKSMYEYVLANHAAEGKWLFVHYEQLMNGERWNEIETFTNAPTNREFIDPEANRSQPVDCPRDAEVEGLYRRLCELANYRVE